MDDTELPIARQSLEHPDQGGMRGWPALISVILIVALVVGPLVSTLPLAEYFRAPELYRYLMGVTGLVGFNLPGWCGRGNQASGLIFPLCFQALLRI